MTDNVVNPFSAEMARRQQEAGAKAAQAQHYGRSVFDSTDALLGELLREVLEMRQQVASLQDKLDDMRLRNDVGLHHHGREFPPNALRHGTPR